MKFEIGKFYRTRDGQKMLIIDFCPENPRPLRVYNHTLHGGILQYYADGRYAPKSWEDTNLDLISEWTEPRKGTVWVNVYPDNIAGPYDTFAVANEFSTDRRIARVRIDWSEGQFDE